MAIQTFYGADVSEWQGVIDWPTFNPGASFVWIKGSGGDGVTTPHYVDAQLANNKSGVRALGNEMPHGYFHYAGNKTSPQSQAQYFFDNVCNDLQVGEAVALDFEVEVPDANAWVEAFKSTLESLLGFHMVLYVDTDRLNRFGFKIVLTTSPLWEANYGFTPDQTIPGPMYTFHQFKDNGTFPGITGPVDTDAFFAEDITDFFKLGKPAAPAPAPQTVIQAAPAPAPEPVAPPAPVIPPAPVVAPMPQVLSPQVITPSAQPQPATSPNAVTKGGDMKYLRLLGKHFPYVVGVLLIVVNALVANGDLSLSAHVVDVVNSVLAAFGLGALHARQG
jgi:GH25 family lysozyme M1 (1,4-beta-N-acetylmuramidase)